jgi:ribosomal protein L18
MKSKDREVQRLRRHRRVRRSIVGTAERPRLVVHRSSKNMQGHLANDVEGRILLGVSTLAAEVQSAWVPPVAATPETGTAEAGTAEAAASPPAEPEAPSGKKGKKAGKEGKEGKEGKSAGPEGRKGGKEGKTGKAGGKAGKDEKKAAAAAGRKTALSRAAGKLLAEKAKAAGITRVVFDRGGYLYHGRVAAFAEGAREGGLEF